LSSSTAQAISDFARVVIRALAGIAGVASVNDLRLHKTLAHNHLRFRQMICGRSGPILISRGRVVTQPFDRRDRVAHFGHLPTHSSAVPATTTRTPSSPSVTVSTTIPSRPSSNVLPLDKLAPFCDLDA
jgi:hypothetical protein